MCRVSTPSDRIALIGVGASALVSRLVETGYRNIDAIDLSANALEQLRLRLTAQFETSDVGVRFVESDVLEVEFDEPVDLWHDRATFHFLIDESDQIAYVASASRSVRSGGHLILAGFSATGPQQCSGLDVARHTPDSIDRLFAGSFGLVDRFDETHTTPWGAEQSFMYSLFRRV